MTRSAIALAHTERPVDPAAAAEPTVAIDEVPRSTEDGAARRLARGRRRRAGTALRLAVFQTSVLAAVLVIVVAALFHQFSASYQSLATDALSAQLGSFTTAATQSAVTSAGMDAFSRRYLRTHTPPAGDQLLVSVIGRGTVSTPGADTVLAVPAVARWLVAPPASTQTIVARVGNHDVEILASPVQLGGRTVATFVATTSLAALDEQRSRVVRLAIAEAAVAVIAGALSAYLLLRRLLRTIGRITRTAEEIHEGDLELRLGDQGTDDEVSQLAGTFDAMLDRLSSVMRSQRRLLSDVSHQLRTPMTVARGHLEVLTRTGFADEHAASDTVALVLDELGHMSVLVESLVLLGRAIEPDFLQPEPIDLRSFIADLFEAARVLAPRRWSLGQVADVVLWADPAKLRGALLNVVDNAVKVTRSGDAITVAASIDDARGALVLSVDDAGPGIPPDQRAAVLERFTRLQGRAVEGTGLGLAIVDAVARAHDGAVVISTSLLGGARVAIELPVDRLVHDPEAVG